MAQNGTKFAGSQDQAANIKSEKSRDIRSTNIIAAKGKSHFAKQAYFAQSMQQI